ncbi:HAD hydrolase-like protein [Nonomuraea fuscirosea]|uniref:HAD family hydrolase n=1 Tax=Nonomuraea fuscirosea TaxID=1291556 RepID=UPI002DD79F6A|nr:HAD hydrolase-like protein [Nonomuraea fuscirosea]WSA51452.1 HAD hydrolase-like protein [Nonomuraea fuscirosea]
MPPSSIASSNSPARPPGETLYVGDHPVNDVIPAKAAGLVTCLIRRGPWGLLWGDDPTVPADLRINGLADLPALLDTTGRSTDALG